MKQIVNAKVVTRDSILEGKTLLFDERIIALLDTPREGIETVDAEGKYLIPGLIDLHTHLKGVSCDKYGIAAESCCFPFGVTAAVDAGAELGRQNSA